MGDHQFDLRDLLLWLQGSGALPVGLMAEPGSLPSLWTQTPTGFAPARRFRMAYSPANKLMI